MYAVWLPKFGFVLSAGASCDVTMLPRDALSPFMTSSSPLSLNQRVCTPNCWVQPPVHPMGHIQAKTLFPSPSLPMILFPSSRPIQHICEGGRDIFREPVPLSGSSHAPNFNPFDAAVKFQPELAAPYQPADKPYAISTLLEPLGSDCMHDLPLAANAAQQARSGGQGLASCVLATVDPTSPLG